MVVLLYKIKLLVVVYFGIFVNEISIENGFVIGNDGSCIVYFEFIVGVEGCNDVVWLVKFKDLL